MLVYIQLKRKFKKIINKYQNETENETENETTQSYLVDLRIQEHIKGG